MMTIAKQRKEEDYWKNLGCPAIAEVIYDVLNVAKGCNGDLDCHWDQFADFWKSGSWTRIVPKLIAVDVVAKLWFEEFVNGNWLSFLKDPVQKWKDEWECFFGAISYWGFPEAVKKEDTVCNE